MEQSPQLGAKATKKKIKNGTDHLDNQFKPYEIDDFNNDVNNSGHITVGGTATGNIEQSEDKDWFRVTLKANQTYQIDLTGTGLNDPYLYGIFGQDRTQIANTQNDDYSGLNSRVVFTPTENGIYYISAGAFASQTGTYQLEVSPFTPPPPPPPQPVDDYSADIYTTGLINPGLTTQGVIEQSADIDWFSTTLTPGNTYQFTLSSNQPYELAIGSIHNQDGSFAFLDSMTWLEDGSYSVSFSPAEQGTYYIAIGATNHVTTGSYQLNSSVSPAPIDDYSADIYTTGSVSVGTSTPGTLATAYDIDWFRVELHAGQSYAINLTGPYGAAPYMTGIYDSLGQLSTDIDSNVYALQPSSLSFTPSVDASYFIGVCGLGGMTGNYDLSVIENTLVLPNINDVLSNDTSLDSLVGNSIQDAYNSIITSVSNINASITLFSQMQALPQLQIIEAA